MTDPEFKTLAATIHHLWPRWDATGERLQIIKLMFRDYSLGLVVESFRKAWRDDPESSKPPLGKLASTLRSITSADRGTYDFFATRIVQHRNHYASWPGWEYPGDTAIRDILSRGELTPLQVHCFRELARRCLSKLDGSALDEDCRVDGNKPRQQQIEELSREAYA